jgi:hypothetical protein
MCQKGARAEGHVALPPGRPWKAWLGMNYLPVLGPSGQGRVGDRSRRRQAHRASRWVDPTPGNAGKPGGVARRRLGRPARPRNQYTPVLWGGAVVDSESVPPTANPSPMPMPNVIQSIQNPRIRVHDPRIYKQTTRQY